MPKREKKFFPQQNDDCTHMWGNIEKIEKKERKNLLLVLLLKFLIFWPGAGLSTSLSSSSSFVFTCDYFSSSLFLGLVKKRVGLSVVCVHERVPTLLTWRTHGSLALCLSQLASLSCVTSCTSSLGRELYDLLRSPAPPLSSSTQVDILIGLRVLSEIPSSLCRPPALPCPRPNWCLLSGRRRLSNYLAWLLSLFFYGTT